MDFSYIGQQLKRYRGRYDLSLETFAEKSGVSRSMLCQLEMGRTTPTLTVAQKLAVAMDMSLGQLVDPGVQNEISLLVPESSKPSLKDAKSGYKEWFLNEQSSQRDIEVYRWSSDKKTSREVGLCRTRKRSHLWLHKGSCKIMLASDEIKLSAGDYVEIRTPAFGYSVEMSAGSAGIWVHVY